MPTATLPEAHPLSEQLWMPRFFREQGFFFTEAKYPDVPLLEPPSKCFPWVDGKLLDSIVENVQVIREEENDQLVKVGRRDPLKQALTFGEHDGQFHEPEINDLVTQEINTVHSNSGYFKPSIYEIALQVFPGLWRAVKFLRCDGIPSSTPTPTGHENVRTWPERLTLVDPETGEGIRPGRLHLARTTLYIEP